MDEKALKSWCEAHGLHISDRQLAAFTKFEEALYTANEVMNLTRVPRDECWIRHFADSLLIQDLLPQKSTVLDIGTGPGFPAWPLACVRPDMQVTALDSNGKMLGFLRTQPLPNVAIEEARAEEWQVRERFDVVTGRALAPLPIQLEVSAAFCKVGGFVLPMRTPNDDLTAPDVKNLGLELEQVYERPLQEIDAVRLFPLYRKVAKTPRTYPRRWAEIKIRPLSC